MPNRRSVGGGDGGGGEVGGGRGGEGGEGSGHVAAQTSAPVAPGGIFDAFTAVSNEVIANAPHGSMVKTLGKMTFIISVSVSLHMFHDPCALVP